jgi:tellurite resistance protein TerC
MNSIATTELWVGFGVAVTLMIVFDLNLTRLRGGTTPKSAAGWTLVWVSLSLAFGGWLWFHFGHDVGAPFLTAWVVEYALSVDNLFVFLVIFSFFKVPTKAQHRLLYWGVVGAFVMRGAMIFAGTALVQRFSWLLYVFGGFLLYTAYKLLFAGESDEKVDPQQSPVFRYARKVLPVSGPRDDEAFTTREDGKFKFTPLFLVLLVVETSDVLFALDSIPAVLGISQDPFIVFASNVCAILGLRSLFFVVESLMSKFHYLKVGLGIILGFVGVKLITETAFHSFFQQYDTHLIVGSLSFIVLTLTISIVASILRPQAAADGQASKVGS